MGQLLDNLDWGLCHLGTGRNVRKKIISASSEEILVDRAGNVSFDEWLLNLVKYRGIKENDVREKHLKATFVWPFRLSCDHRTTKLVLSTRMHLFNCNYMG